MFLSGVRVPDDQVLRLAGQLKDGGHDATAERLEHAYDMQTQLLSLTAADREAILDTLENCDTEELAKLRTSLRTEFRARFSHDLRTQATDPPPGEPV